MFTYVYQLCIRNISKTDVIDDCCLGLLFYSKSG